MPGLHATTVGRALVSTVALLPVVGVENLKMRVMSSKEPRDGDKDSAKDEVEVLEAPEKSPADVKEYRVIRLWNGLTAILVPACYIVYIQHTHLLSYCDILTVHVQYWSQKSNFNSSTCR